MSNIFAELQMLSMQENNTIQKTRKDMNKIVEVFKARDEYLQEITIAAETLRNLKTETFIKHDVFMVQDDLIAEVIPEELRHDSLGFCRDNWLVFIGRLVYPVKDVHGDVMGWCGYDKFHDVKYLDSKNFGYRAKVTSVYGEEMLPEAYRSNDVVFFTEGIVCTLFLRQENFFSFATLGSTLSTYQIEIIKRFGSRARVITDSDEAGNKFRAQVLKNCPLARPLQSRIAKDLDDSRLVEPEIITELPKLRNPFYRSKYFK